MKCEYNYSRMRKERAKTNMCQMLKLVSGGEGIQLIKIFMHYIK